MLSIYRYCIGLLLAAGTFSLRSSPFAMAATQSSYNVICRPARPSDAESLTDTMIAAMSLDPQWDYRFQHRHKFPEDHRNNTKLLVDLFINPEYDDWHVMVVESPEGQIMSFSIWDISYRNKRKNEPGYKAQNRECPFLVPQSVPYYDYGTS
jgi:hypothetical protein